LEDSPEFSQIFCKSTPEQPTAAGRPFTPMEESFFIDEAEYKLINPVDIKVSPDQPSLSTPTELKLDWQKRCEIFFQTRIPTPPTRRKSLPLLPPTPIDDSLNADLSFRDSRDTEMVTNRIWTNCSFLTKRDSEIVSDRSLMMHLSSFSINTSVATEKDSEMGNNRSFWSSLENLDCDMDLAPKCPSELSHKPVFTPPQDKSKLMVSSPTPVLLSGARARPASGTNSVSKIRQRLEWDYSPIQMGKSKIIKRRASREMFKKRRAVKRVKVKRRVRPFLGELDPNIQRGNTENRDLKTNRILGRKQRVPFFERRASFQQNLTN